MHATFLPLTVIPGASRQINPETLAHVFDKKGFPVWDMPTPLGMVQHTKRSMKGTGEDKIVIKEKISVPVYRGTSASYFRHLKSQMRRQKRISQEKIDAE